MGYYGENMDIDESNMFLDIEEEKEILSAAINQSSVGILMTDLRGNIIYANNAIKKYQDIRYQNLLVRILGFSSLD